MYDKTFPIKIQNRRVDYTLKNAQNSIRTENKHNYFYLELHKYFIFTISFLHDVPLFQVVQVVLIHLVDPKKHEKRRKVGEVGKFFNCFLGQLHLPVDQGGRGHKGIHLVLDLYHVHCRATT